MVTSMSSPEHADAQVGASLHELIDHLTRIPEEQTPHEVVQLLLTVAARRYVAARAAGADFGPLVHDDALNATEVMVLVSNLLHAADIEVFELAMWATPGTRPVTEEVPT